MNPTRRSDLNRRTAGVLAGLAALLASITAGPAAFASPPRADPPGWLHRLPVPAHLPPGWDKHPPLPGPADVRAALAGGMPGWQITLIVVAAAVVTAVSTVFLVRAPRCTPARTQADAR